MLTVYGKDGCGYCVKAIDILNTKQMMYKYIKVGEDIGITEFTATYPNVKSVPFIVRGEEVIGTYSDLLKYVEETASGFADNF